MASSLALTVRRSRCGVAWIGAGDGAALVVPVASLVEARLNMGVLPLEVVAVATDTRRWFPLDGGGVGVIGFGSSGAEIALPGFDGVIPDGIFFLP